MKVELLRDVEGVGQKGDRLSLAEVQAVDLIGKGWAKEMRQTTKSGAYL